MRLVRDRDDDGANDDQSYVVHLRCLWNRDELRRLADRSENIVESSEVEVAGTNNDVLQGAVAPEDEVFHMDEMVSITKLTGHLQWVPV